MPIQYLIPAFIAMLLVMAIPFFNGREYRLLLKLLFGLSFFVIPLAIASMEARNVFEFFSIWFMVLLAPFLWLFGGGAAREASIGTGEGGIMAQILPWLPLVAVGVVLAMIIVLKLMHSRAERREPH